MLAKVTIGRELSFHSLVQSQWAGCLLNYQKLEGNEPSGPTAFVSYQSQEWAKGFVLRNININVYLVLDQDLI